MSLNRNKRCLVVRCHPRLSSHSHRCKTKTSASDSGEHARAPHTLWAGVPDRYSAHRALGPWVLPPATSTGPEARVKVSGRAPWFCAPVRSVAKVLY